MHALTPALRLHQSYRLSRQIPLLRPLLLRLLGVAAGTVLLLLVVSVDPVHAQSHQGIRAEAADPRLREVWYDPHAVVTVPVKRGVVTHVLLDASETITEVGSGLGSDCTRPEASWCVAAQSGGRSLFVKPKSSAGAPNNLAVVTNLRTHALRFVVLGDGDARQPVYRLAIKSSTASPPASDASGSVAAKLMAPTHINSELVDLAGEAPAEPPPGELVAERLAAAPIPANSRYSLAEGRDSNDIVPTLVFDDGRFTYLRFPNNRELPAVFHVQGDGTETLVNARMEGDLLVIDRVSRRLMLRSGSAVVGIWNEAFDLDGQPASGGASTGTTIAGVRRVLKASEGEQLKAPATPGAQP